MIGFIVEGFNDEKTLKEVYPDAHYVVTKGTRFDKRVKMDIQKALDECSDVFSLMDPDEPGQMMTQKIVNAFWSVTPIEIEEEVAVSYRNNFKTRKVGVEHCDPAYLKKVIDEVIINERYKHFYGYTLIFHKLQDKFYDGPNMHENFTKDLFKAFEVEDNPKKDKCFSIAWEHGHSAGYHEVLNYFSEFVELIK